MIRHTSTAKVTKTPTASHKPWMQKAWPEGAQALQNLRETVMAKGELDEKTKWLIQLACVSMLRCKHCVDGTLNHVKNEVGATDREIAEAMMVASTAAAGTNIAWAKEVFEQHVGC